MAASSALAEVDLLGLTCRHWGMAQNRIATEGWNFYFTSASRSGFCRWPALYVAEVWRVSHPVHAAKNVLRSGSKPVPCASQFLSNNFRTESHTEAL
jgi:hypothetical protein